MKRKIGLSREQLNKIVIQELQLAVEEGRLDEGIWQSIKHAVAKTLGTWEKGGKIWGRSKRDKAAKAQTEKALDKLANKAKGEAKDLAGQMMEKLKETGFPNQKSTDEFGAQADEIGNVYTALVGATKNGKMEFSVTNELIDALRVIIKRSIDYDLYDLYKHLTEAEEEDSVNEVWPFSGRKKKQQRSLRPPGTEGDEGEPEEGEPEEEGPIETGKETAAMASMKSLKLPTMLGLIGAGGLLGKLLVDSQWFVDLTTEAWKMNVPFMDLQNKVIGKLSPLPGEGFTQMAGRLLHGDSGFYDSNVPAARLFRDMRTAGWKPRDLAKLSADPGKFMKAFRAAKASGVNTLGEMFPLEEISVGKTVGEFADFMGGLSPEDVQKVTARAVELGAAENVTITPDVGIARALLGGDVPSGIPDGVDMLARRARHGDPGIRGAGATMKFLNRAAQEMGATSKGPGDLGLKLGKSVVIKALKPVMKRMVVSGTKRTAAGMAGVAASQFLGPLAIAAPVGALGIMALRKKAQHSSRLKVLNDLLQNMNYIDEHGKPTETKPDPSPEPEPEAEPAPELEPEPEPEAPAAPAEPEAEAAPEPEWDPKLGAKPEKKPDETDEKYAKRLKTAAAIRRSRLTEIRRFQQLAGIIKG
jgi:hypothetical protein